MGVRQGFAPAFDLTVPFPPARGKSSLIPSPLEGEKQWLVASG